MSYKKILPGILIVSALSIVSFLYIGIEGDGVQMPAAVSFLADNLHTGLITNPGTQLALKDKDENSTQYAKKTPVDNNQGANNNDQVAILNNNPTVLFDISAQPLFGKSSQMNLILWISLISASLLLTIFFVRKIYKQNKLQKIKNIK